VRGKWKKDKGAHIKVAREEHLAHILVELGEAEGLVHKTIHPDAKTLLVHSLHSSGSHTKDAGVAALLLCRLLCPNQPGSLVPINAGHQDIQDDEVVLIIPDERNRLTSS